MEMKFYTMAEVEKILKLDKITISEKVKAGELKAFKPGRKYLFSEEQIKEFLNNSLTA